MRFRRSRGLVAIGVLAVVASACSSRLPVDEPDPDGTLTTLSSFEPGTIDPQKASDAREVGHVMMVFEPLLRLDPKTLRPLPAAAKFLPEVSADGLTYRLTLREDGRYSDGTPVRATDFAHGFTRLCDPAIKGYYASIGYIIAGCAGWSGLDPAKDAPEQQRAARQKLLTEGIRVLGERELSFTLVEPAAYFPSILATWVGLPVRESDVTRGGQAWTEPATYIGNGPFVLSAWQHQERMAFTPNRYHRSPPRIKTWTKVLGGQEAVALNAYRHDELDELVISGASGAPVLPEIEADGTLRKEIIRQADLCTYTLGFNTRRPPFDDPAVRLAFAKGIDRGAYVREVLGGLGVAAMTWIPPGQPGHDPADSVQRFDPAEARRLLASSRYADSPALRTIVIPIGANLTNRARLDWLRGQWLQHLGVAVTIQKIDDPSVLTQLYRRVETIPQTYFAGWCADYADQQNWLSLLFESNSSAGLRRNTGFQSAEFDRLVRAADREADRARRDALYQQAQRLLSAEAAVAYLNNGLQVILRKPWVKGVVDSPWDWELGLTQRWEGVFIAKKRG